MYSKKVGGILVAAKMPVYKRKPGKEHGSVPKAVPGITVGHEMVGIVEQVGTEVYSVKPGDRVTDEQALLGKGNIGSRNNCKKIFY